MGEVNLLERHEYVFGAFTIVNWKFGWNSYEWSQNMNGAGLIHANGPNFSCIHGQTWNIVWVTRTDTLVLTRSNEYQIHCSRCNFSLHLEYTRYGVFEDGVCFANVINWCWRKNPSDFYVVSFCSATDRSSPSAVNCPENFFGNFNGAFVQSVSMGARAIGLYLVLPNWARSLRNPMEGRFMNWLGSKNGRKQLKTAISFQFG